MDAIYWNEYQEQEACILLGHNLSGTMCLISLDGVRGWTSASNVEEL